MMYTNDNSGADLSNGHHVPVQMVGPHQTEELYKRSVMLVIWYKVSSVFFSFFFVDLGPGVLMRMGACLDMFVWYPCVHEMS